MTEDRYGDRKRRLLEIVRAAQTFARDLGNERHAATFETIGAQLSAARFPMLVCGEFKRGKSSLIGALLGDAALAPADVDVATNVVSSFAFADFESISVRLDGRTEAADRGALRGFVTEAANSGNRLAVEHVTILTPSERLRSGLTLFDSPGIGGANTAHSAVTYGLLPSVAAAIFVADVVQPLSKTELDFAAQALRHVDRVIVVLTKIDLIRDPAIALDDARRKLAPLLGKAPAAVEIVAVSNTAYFDYLRSGDPLDFDDSNFAELEALLRAVVEEERAQIVLTRGIARTREALGRLVEPLQLERRALADRSSAARDEIEAQFAATAERLHEIAGGAEAWKRHLGRRLQDARLEVGEQLASDLRALEAKFTNVYLTDDALIKNPDAVAELLARDSTVAIAQTQKLVRAAARELADDLERRSGLVLESEDAAAEFAVDFVAPSGASDPVKLSREERFDRGFTLARWGAGSAGMAGGGAALAGAVLGPAAPVVAAALFGVALFGSVRMALNQFEKEDRNARREAVRAMCRPFLADVSGRANAALTRTTVALERNFSDAFDAALKAEQQDLADTRRALDAARAKSAAEAQARIDELDRSLSGIERLQSALGIVASVPRAPVAAGPVAAALSDGQSWADG